MQDGRRNPGSANRFARTWLALAAVAAVTACASMREYTEADYEQGSAPAAKFANDARACEKQAEEHAKEHGYALDPTHGAYNRMYDACMRSSGYQRKKAVE